MWPFRRKTKPAPCIGQKYLLDLEPCQINPWNGVPEVVITDVRDGWVRYKFGSATVASSMPTRRFLSIYRPITK